MPFGLNNTPKTFHKCMLSIFNYMLENCLKAFMDDLTLFENSFNKFLHNLESILEMYRESGLALNWEKCQFMTTSGVVWAMSCLLRKLKLIKAKLKLY